MAATRDGYVPKETDYFKIANLKKKNKQLRIALERFVDGLKNNPYYLVDQANLDIKYAEKVLKEER